jgi:pathogenesis-related protein 1
MRTRSSRRRARASLALVALVVLGLADAAAHKERAQAMAADLANPDAYVEAHNRVRADVQRPEGYQGSWAPLPPLAWSVELAAGAQQWAEHLRDDGKCKLAHSDTRDGENLAIGKGLGVAQAVRLWADEGKRYTYAPVYEFEIPTGHYTQVVWRKTTHLGCGFANCGSTVVIVCRYNPPGNHIGKAPF